MMKLTTSVFAIIISVIAGIFTTSCNSETDSGDIPGVCYDFATFVSTSDEGTVFTLRKNGDSPLITLTAAVKVDISQLKPDTRVLIKYLPSGGQAPYESGPITLYGLGLIFTGDVDSEPLATIESWKSDVINLKTMTRSGEYLDIEALGDYSSKATKFCLVADEATLNDEYPQLYLVFEGDNGLGYPHQLYASFTLSNVWELPTCKGVTINYHNYSGMETQTFNKTDN